MQCLEDDHLPSSNPPLTLSHPTIHYHQRFDSRSSFISINFNENSNNNLNNQKNNGDEDDKSVYNLQNRSLDDCDNFKKLMKRNTHGNINKDFDKDENNIEKKVGSISFFKLFQYASILDKIYMCIGTFFAFCVGMAFPGSILLLGRITDTFIKYNIFHQLVIAQDISFRHDYYDTTLKNISSNNVQLYFEKIQEYYSMLPHKYDIKILSPDKIRLRLGLSTENIVQIFNDSIFQNGNLYVENFRTDSGKFSLYMILVAIGFAILDYFALALWEQAAYNQIYKIKLLFFRSIIHQDIAWFDVKASGDFATKINNDLNMVQQGIGDKIALTIIAFSTLIFSTGIALYYGWELTLVSMAIMPVLAISFTMIGKIQTKFALTDSKAYNKAGSIAEEVFNSIRTVFAFEGQDKEIERYQRNIEPVRRNGIRRSLFTGISLGFVYFAIYASYGLSFWYGVNLILRSIEREESPSRYQASTMLIIFFNVLIGAFSLGQTSPYFESIARACGAAESVFKIMQQKQNINSLSQEGKRIKIQGKIQFRNVHFSYPSRKEVKILNGLNLEAQPGQTIALVGSSGCGKSTIIQLIQRFYDTDCGTVLIDDNDIRKLNVGSLRDQIGVVEQEPVLFGYSIGKNIAFGHPEANMEEVIQAAKDANAYEFIQNLPEKFNTLVGQHGLQLSSSQKQRIAIARALIRCPKILLLDEFTSTLDSESEAIAHAVLEKASIERTTLIVAHQLSTIRNADKIIVIDQGQVKEMGTHQELIDAKGTYYNMLWLQNQDKILSLKTKKPITLNINNEKMVSRMTFERTKSINSTSSMKYYTDINNENNDGKDLDSQSLPIRRLIKFVMPDRNYLILATLFSFICGLSIPIYSFIFGEILDVLSNPDMEYIRSQVLKYCLIFFAMGIITGIFQFLQSYLYGISSENLTYRMRNEMFRTILKQEVAWFDQPSNSTGALCARLSNDASAVQGVTGSRLSVFAQTVSILSAGIIISMVYCWKLSLVMLCFIPITLISIYFQMKVMGMTISKQKVSKEATKITFETISNIRTVASLHLELTFWINYQTALEVDFRKSRLEPHIKSLTFAFTQMSFNLAYAIALFYGSRLIISDQLKYGELFKSTEAVLFGTNMIGQSVAFSADFQKGKTAIIAIFKLLDRIPKIVVNSIFGTKPSECHGEITFKDVEFCYPTRPQARVLKRISFQVNRDQTVALVGNSGSGKSTCTQILERFYDINYGEVLVDSKNIHYLNIAWLRSQIGIVSQELVLFNKTIAENIAYGDNSRQVGMEEIVRACQQANIHEFIKSLSKGYETLIGDRGAQLSGGQKQRIAIARALIRNPKILLLDEATNVLDLENEKVFQKTLDEARLGRTCLIIKHRLSTIRDVDRIFVVENGHIVEEGTHNELLEQRGIFFQMYMAQSCDDPL